MWNCRTLLLALLVLIAVGCPVRADEPGPTGRPGVHLIRGPAVLARPAPVDFTPAAPAQSRRMEPVRHMGRVQSMLTLDPREDGEQAFMLTLGPGEVAGISIDESGAGKVVIGRRFDAPKLTEAADEAVGLAPSWLRIDLEENLGRLDKWTQDDLAGLMTGVEDARTLDEIAFVIAHTAAADLMDFDFDPAIIAENARLIYEYDAELDYVSLRDVGTPGVDSDFYTTTVYQIQECSGEECQPAEFELPREYYYWYVVHIRLTDEPPSYLNPATGGRADPPEGVFWRNYLWDGAAGSAPSYLDHYLLNNPEVIDADGLDGWGPTAAGTLGAFDIDPLVIVHEAGTGAPVLTEFRIGSGTVVATTLRAEAAYAAGQSSLLVNLLLYGNGNVPLRASASVVVLQDRPGDDLVQTLLLEGGFDAASCASADLADLDLAGVAKMVVPSDQPRELFDALAETSAREKLEEWVGGGGVLEIHGAVATADDWSGLVLPGGVRLGRGPDHAVDAVEVGGHPSLAEVLAGVAVLWDGVAENISGDRARAEGDHALNRIGYWVTQNMFDNVAEKGAKDRSHPNIEFRAVQPVRIAFNHFGNCGELQDMLAAASRTALVPAWGVSNSNEDHVWNEVRWTDRWITYQVSWSDGSTHIDQKNVSGDDRWGGGKHVSMVSGWRGDTRIINRAPEYTQTFRIEMELLFPSGRPVDGARVMFVSEAYQSAGLIANHWDVTGPDGRLTVDLGDTNNYYIYIDAGPDGVFPPDQPPGSIVVAQIAAEEDAVEGAVLRFPAVETQCGTCGPGEVCMQGPVGDLACRPMFTEHAPRPRGTLADPSWEAGSILARVTVTPASRLMVAEGWRYGYLFSEPWGPGQVDVYVADQAAFDLAAAGKDFGAATVAEGLTQEQAFDLDVPGSGTASLLLANFDPVVMHQRVEVRVKVEDVAGDGCGCTSSPAPSSSVLVFALAALALAWFRREG